MKQLTTKDKLSIGKPVTDNILIMILKDFLRPALSFLVSSNIPYKVFIEKPCFLLPDRPVIYAVNHFCFADCPIMGRISPKRSYILTGKQRLGFLDWLYFMLNGVIFVDRKNKADMEVSKLGMSEYLNRGRSIVMFPEGTWNLTENQLMMPMKWGIIDVAKKTDAQIVPVALEYQKERKQCVVRFGEPMVFSQEADRGGAIAALRDAMSTMLWEQL